MWNLDLEKIAKLCGGQSAMGALAIETGTCRGNGARHLAKAFPRVITIELSTELNAQARSRLALEFPQIQFLQGNSAEQFRRILPLEKEPAAFFFLDAHWSGDSSVNWDQSEWKGYGIETAHLASANRRPSSEEQCPLEEELHAIVQNFRGRAFILIDDMKNLPPAGPGLKNSTFAGEDWSHLSRERLLEIVEPRFERLHELENPCQWLLVLGQACS